MRKQLLFFFFLLHIQWIDAQSVLDKPITLRVDHIPLIEILDRISTQADVRFAYDKKRIPIRKKLSLQVENSSLEAALAQLLAGTEIQFSASKKQIALYRKQIPYHTISGYIRDTLSEEALIAANIFETQYFRGTSSNSYGFYSLSLPEGSHLLKVTFVGYQELVDTIELYQDIQQDIFLKVGNELNEVLVIGNPNAADEAAAILQKSQDNGEQINVNKAKLLPTILGQSDILKSVQLLPGVISGGLNGNKLYVRGGHADQNLVLLDDVPLYNLNHIFGVISIINGDIIHSATTYLDGIPARYGGRLSSLVDIRTREGHKQKYQGGAAFGPVIGTAYLEGPIQKGKSSFIVSGRTTWLPTNLQFHDVNAKVNFKLSAKDRLFISFYTGTDNIINAQEDQLSNPVFKETITINWRNTAMSMRWNRILNKQVFLNTTLFQGTFNYAIQNIEIADSLRTTVLDLHYTSFIRQHGIKTDFNYLPSTKHHIRFGASYRYLQNNTGRLDRTITLQGIDKLSSETSELLSAHQPYFYLEDDFQINNKIQFNAGFHLAAIKVPNKTWWTPQFRFLFNYAASPTHYWSFSYGEMAQYIHLLNDSGIEAGDSKWVSTTNNIRPSTARQFAVNYQSFFHPNWKLKIGTYYKKMEHLRRFKIGATVTNSIKNWEDNTAEGIGKAYGVEFLLAKTRGATQGWLSYTLSKNQRQFEDFIDNQLFPHQQDKRHILNVNVQHHLKEKKGKQRQWNMVWSFASGQWATLPERGFISQSGVRVPDYEVVNNFQLQPNHRLDISYHRQKMGKKGFQHQWTFGIYNVYGRINPYATFLEYTPTTTPFFDLKGEYLAGFPVPFVTYAIRLMDTTDN